MPNYSHKDGCTEIILIIRLAYKASGAEIG
jgi:hypothetical protein